MKKLPVSAMALFLIVAPAVFAQGVPRIGDQAPEISVDVWVNRGRVNLARLQRDGKVTVLEFWATW